MSASRVRSKRTPPRTAARIVRELRARRFRGDLATDIFDVIDLEATTRAYEPASAAFLPETASRLQGPRTANGRKAAADAERIWRQILPSEGSKG